MMHRLATLHDLWTGNIGHHASLGNLISFHSRIVTSQSFCQQGHRKVKVGQRRKVLVMYSAMQGTACSSVSCCRSGGQICLCEVGNTCPMYLPDFHMRSVSNGLRRQSRRALLYFQFRCLQISDHVWHKYIYRDTMKVTAPYSYALLFEY